MERAHETNSEEDPRTRFYMSETTYTETENALARGELGIDPAQFGTFLDSLKAEEVDPYKTVLALEGCSPYFRDTAAADLGLLRPERGREHLEAELRQLETGYITRFADPEERQMLRMNALFGTLLKPFTKAATDENLQAKVNQDLSEAADIMFKDIPVEQMRPEVWEGAFLLRKYDLIMKMLTGSFSTYEYNEARQACPPEFLDGFDDRLVVAYLAAAGAHTKHAYYTNRDASPDAEDYHIPCVTPEDIEKNETLDRFLMRSYSGAPLKLRLSGRRMVNNTLRHTTDRVADLLVDYTAYKQEPGVWSTMLGVPERTTVAEVERVLGNLTLRTGKPINGLLELDPKSKELLHVSLVRDPSGRETIPDPPGYESLTDELLRGQPSWHRIPNLAKLGDIDACIGYSEGYDGLAPSSEEKMKALCYLLEQGIKLEHISGSVLLRAYWVNDGSLEHWPEEIMRVIAKAENPNIGTIDIVEAIKKTAAMLGQQRVFLSDATRETTIALGS
jgi:hypothetical protein